MARKKKHEEHVNHERWLVSYADFITLLFATFTALYAIGNSDLEKLKAMAESMKASFNSSASLTPTISLDDSSGNGDLVINIVDNSSTRPGEGGGEGKSGRGGEPVADERIRNFDPVSDVMQTAMANMRPVENPERSNNAHQLMQTLAQPTATPLPSPSPTPVPEATTEAASGGDMPMGTPEGAASTRLAQDIQQLMNDAGLEGMVEVRHEVRGTVISLGEAAFFAPGGVEVLPQSTHTLSRILNVLRQTPLQVRIEGHTDDTPVGGGRESAVPQQLGAVDAAGGARDAVHDR